MNSNDNELRLLESCLELCSEPMALLDLESNQAVFNRELAYLLGGEERRIAIADFWPGFIERELESGSVISEFKTFKGEFASVKLVTSLLAPNIYCLRVIASRLSHDTEKVFHQQRREMLGTLAGGVAHDINNIITGVLGHVNYLRLTLPKTGTHKDSITAIEEGGNRAAELVRQILSFIKHDATAEPQKLNLCSVAEGNINLLRGALSKKIKLISELPQTITSIVGVESQVSQVIINLVINARDAVGEKGEIRIVLRELETSEVIDPIGEIKGTERLSGRYACLSVIDNGHGISNAILGRVFEPYFSTKKDHGTGLGLSTVKDIVEKMGGVIEISSKSGIGTKVSVYIPIFEEIPADTQNDSEELEGGTERILVVDDEQSIRNVLGLSLRRLGYDVELSSSGSEAISKYIAANSNYDLVILDMVMPELSGKEIFFRLKEIDPSVRVLICSAFASEQSIRDILDNGGRGFIQKPFDVEDLAHKIRKCLD